MPNKDGKGIPGQGGVTSYNYGKAANLMQYLPIVGGFAQTAFNTIQQDKMNRYNSPTAQLQRLNAAGLPFSAFSAGQAGNQSSTPDGSGIQQGISAYMTGNIQMQQLKLIKEQVRAAAANADTAEYVAAMKEDEAKYSLGYGTTGDGTQGYGAVSGGYAFKRQAEIDTANAVYAAAEKEKEIKTLELKIMNDREGRDAARHAKELELIALDIANKTGLKLSQERLDGALNRIIEKIEKGGTSMMESILITILQLAGNKMR